MVKVRPKGSKEKQVKLGCLTETSIEQSSGVVNFKINKK
jgi:hypothetical protein